jgi:hypothetical protein
MSKMYQMLLGLAMMGAMFENPILNESHELTDEERESIKQIRLKKALKRKKQHGLKEYNIDGIKIWALNEKNAMRKIKKFKDN